MTGEPTAPLITEARFVAQYGDAPITVNDRFPHPIPLKAFVAMEERYCTADPSKRADEATRVSFLAGKLGKDALLPEHLHLLEQPPASGA